MDTLKEERRTVTADQLLRMPHDGYRCELVHGHLVQDLPAGSRHGASAHEPAHLLGNWAPCCGAGVMLGEGLVAGFRCRVGELFA